MFKARGNKGDRVCDGWRTYGIDWLQQLHNLEGKHTVVADVFFKTNGSSLWDLDSDYYTLRVMARFTCTLLWPMCFLKLMEAHFGTWILIITH